MNYPWQEKTWQMLCHLQSIQRLPSALLFAGGAGIGKMQLAKDFVRMLLCEKPLAAFYCNQCHACRLTLTGVHPNLLWIQAAKPGEAIKIDAIRRVGEFVNQSGLMGARRIVLIHPADQMNLHAANALLKTLEEPAQDAMIILISNQSARLPATILSRCQRINFPPPAQLQACNWLQKEIKDDAIDAAWLLNLAQGAPLIALQLFQEGALALRKSLYDQLSLLHQGGDPIQLSAAILTLEPLQFIDWMLSWIMDLLRLQMGMQVINHDYSQQLAAMTSQISVETMTTIMNNLLMNRKHCVAGLALNKQLMFEHCLISFHKTWGS